MNVVRRPWVIWQDGQMDEFDLLVAVEHQAALFAVACEAAGLDAAVPPCPGWDVADLLWHLAGVHWFWGTIVAERRTTPQGMAGLERPADDQLMNLYYDQLGALVEVLRSTDPETPVWSWSGNDKNVAWVIRRMAHETAMHRWDVEAAAGTHAAIDPLLAGDGIDEFLANFLPWSTEGAAPVGGSVHLHCTDTPGEWTVVEGGEGFVVAREHAKGDCALRGAASDLLLVLWHRLPLSAIEVMGDVGVAERFAAHTRLG